ncbi:uncharacterized protein L969DRAFT_96839 [Mixia osmundae IAM 14324]|uniref:Uncharacterized protein n=1 Tax=Mixia osmundae (strain CBS 9802 / IAM 14324 / JCM 22182 / KY 12970) TaxID=764103 RepID=G7E287_MIXOS|nr:uncharacterized protein L969DRAFT_96839 [Mixia osmundae IAM 14324]KEI36820.1 hypothetical protein L969DRAFT_96839 [Mixia osmundae IAM 14324]GAA96947.1 hypothetical protein E5Q_03621 [Mixia osmundae IAM 14324]
MAASSSGLQLTAGISLGPFALGDTLWDVLGLLRSERLAFPTVRVVHGEQKPSVSPIVLILSKPPLRLVFPGSTQRLSLIEVEAPGDHVIYRAKTLRTERAQSPTSARERLYATRRSLSRLFGPTYAPVPHPGYPNEQLVAYPGAMFGYATPSDGSHETVEEPLTRLIVTWPSLTQTTPTVGLTRVMNEAIYLPIAKPSPAEDDDRHLNGLKSVDVLLSPKAGCSAIKLRCFSDSPRDIVIRLNETTSEDLFCDLGPPLRQFYKEDDRLTIHSQHTVSETGSNPCFYSYFNLGIEFLVSPDNLVIKIILHSNLPGQVLFGSFARANWILRREDASEDETGINGDEMPAIRTTIASWGLSNEPMQPMQLDRAADALDLTLKAPTRLVGYPNCVFEVTDSKTVETLWLF